MTKSKVKKSQKKPSVKPNLRVQTVEIPDLNLKPATVYKPKSDEWHRKIAANRGESWKKNVMAGRMEAMLNPSNIRLARIQKSILQSTIAQKLGMSESAFGAIERGRQKVKFEVAELISEILKLPIKKLFTPVGKEKYVAVTRKTKL